MKLTTRPLTERAWLRREQDRSRARFTASWSDTLTLLEREVYAVQRPSMPDPVLMMDITEGDLRLDGQVRANSRPASPAVAVAFESVRGPLIFRCDQYDKKAYGGSMAPWQCNVRAIALTLEALRAVDRYGATQSGEQYTGYRAITSSPESSLGDPWEALSSLTLEPVQVLRSWHEQGRLRSRVQRRVHPDYGGDGAAWERAQAALAHIGGGA